METSNEPVWYSGNVKPIRPGVYERIDPYWYGYWNGSYWMSGAGNEKEAMRSRKKSEEQELQWRALPE